MKVHMKYVLCSFDMCIGETVIIVKKMNTFISPRCFLLYLDNPYLPSASEHPLHRQETASVTAD